MLRNAEDAALCVNITMYAEMMGHQNRRCLWEQLTKLSKLDEFDEEVIRYLIDYVLVYDNEHIEIRWNFDDFQAG